MKATAPAQRGRSRGKPIAMALEPAGIIAANTLDSADHHLVAVLDPFKTNASVERQVFLCRISDLKQMTFETSRGKARDRGIDGIERRQKVANQDKLGGARQGLKGRQ